MGMGHQAYLGPGCVGIQSPSFKRGMFWHKQVIDMMDLQIPSVTVGPGAYSPPAVIVMPFGQAVEQEVIVKIYGCPYRCPFGMIDVKTVVGLAPKYGPSQQSSAQ